MEAGTAEAWIRSYVGAVEGGHAGKTLQLVQAVKMTRNADPSLQVNALNSRLDKEGSAANRNRLLRQWLSEHRDKVVAAWADLGFPMPTDLPEASSQKKNPSQPPPVERPRPEKLSQQVDEQCSVASQSEASRAQRETVRPVAARATRTGEFAGVAVFDFDQTLTTRHVGVFEDMGQAIDRSFGGVARVKMLDGMFREIQSLCVAVVLVSRNSRHVVQSALRSAGLLSYVTDGKIFGFEDYEDDTDKSHVIKNHILPALGVPESCAMLADDDGANIRDMKENCPDAGTLQCPRNGLQQEHCDLIAQWAKNPRREIFI